MHLKYQQRLLRFQHAFPCCSLEATASWLPVLASGQSSASRQHSHLTNHI